MKNFFHCLLLLLLSVTAYATSCPPADLVKSVKLITPMQNSYDPDLWDFNSTTFEYDGKIWNVGFGTFFPNVKTDTEALRLGNNYFANAAVIIKHPAAVEIPNHLFCDYIPTGRLYWMSAITPPT